jgi:cytochrome oxidase Cu insertion factor (SCO1/SenC/PrrC family)
MGAVQQRLNGAVTLVAISVDPWKDTPQSEAAAARRWGWHGPWFWLSSSPSAMRPVWRSFGVSAVSTPRNIVHTAASILVDRQGNERAAFQVPVPTSLVAAQALRVMSSQTAVPAVSSGASG